VRATLERFGRGDFLPGFEDLEQDITRCSGEAGSVIAQVRAEVAGLIAGARAQPGC
jgi:hypothetical protein